MISPSPTLSVAKDGYRGSASRGRDAGATLPVSNVYRRFFFAAFCVAIVAGTHSSVCRVTLSVSGPN